MTTWPDQFKSACTATGEHGAKLEAEFRAGVLARATASGFPRVSLGPAASVCPAIDGWKAFTSNAALSDLADVMLAMDGMKAI